MDEETTSDSFVLKITWHTENNLPACWTGWAWKRFLFPQRETVHLVHEDITAARQHIVSIPGKRQILYFRRSTRSGITFLKCLKAFALVNAAAESPKMILKQNQSPPRHWDHRADLIATASQAKASAAILDSGIGQIKYKWKLVEYSYWPGSRGNGRSFLASRSMCKRTAIGSSLSAGWNYNRTSE